MAFQEKFKIGDIEVDPLRKSLSGPAAANVQLEDKVIEVLALLAHKPGEPLSRDEILAAVWSGQTRSEQTVPVAISKLRRGIVAAGGSVKWIETVPKRGYMLKVPEEALPLTEAASPLSSRSRPVFLVSFFTALVVLAMVFWSGGGDTPLYLSGKADVVIAVQDVRTESEAPADRRKVIAVSEQISYLLAQQPDLLIIRHWWNLDAPDPTGGIYTRHGAKTPVYSLKGRLISQGEQNRVALFLSDPKTEEIIWSGMVDPQAGLAGFAQALAGMQARLGYGGQFADIPERDLGDRYWSARYMSQLADAGSAAVAVRLLREALDAREGHPWDLGLALQAVLARWPALRIPSDKDRLSGFAPEAPHPAATALLDQAQVIWLQEGKPEQALALVEEALSVAPGDHFALFLKAQMLAGEDQAEKLALLERATVLAPFAEAYKTDLRETRAQALRTQEPTPQDH